MPLLLLKNLPRYDCLLEAARSFPDLDPSACDAYLHLLRTGDEAFRVIGANLTNHGMSSGRFTVLMLLLDTKNGHPLALMPTPAELAENAGVTRATMTGLIDTLERDGLVKREPDPGDRRRMPVQLTPLGHSTLLGILPGHFQRMAGIMKTLSQSERKELVRLLDKVAEQAQQHRIVNAPVVLFVKIFITIAALLVIVGSIAGIKILQVTTMIAQGAHATVPPEAVSTAMVKEENWPPTLASVGSLSAVQGVTVAAEMDGKVVEIAFQPGTEVKAGTLLVRQDAAAEMAQLRSAEAGVVLARLNLQRSRELLAKTTISQSQFDSDNAAYEQAVAAADNLRAAIGKKTVRAPFTGRLGVRLVNLGQMLKAGDSIVSLDALNPIFADFYLPEQDLSIIAQGQAVTLTSDAMPGQVVKGVITAINPEVDAATRNVRIQATVQNEAERLRPGMFVRVSVQLPASNRILAIPETSILYAPYGDTVFVVEDKTDQATGKKAKVVRQQVVRLGVTRGDFVEVTSGLTAGETIVSVGAFRLRPGMEVNEQNALAPDAELAPKPKDS